MATGFKKHFVYWVFPALVVAGLMAMYFSGIDWLRQAVAPRVNREFGLLENIQHLILIAILVLAIRSIRSSTVRLRRSMFIVICVVTSWMFLEEVDYGLHWWELIVGTPPEERAVFRNLHNIGGTTQDIKFVGNTIMILLFVVLPFVGRKSGWEWWRFFRPSRYLVITAVVTFFLARLAHYLADQGFYPDGPISSNISEFREVMVYYVWLVYFYALSRKPWPHDDDPGMPVTS
ncbi:MAG: hypothetical protein ACR2QU_05695 [Gammaproteobacteria bacterium]